MKTTTRTTRHRAGTKTIKLTAFDRRKIAALIADDNPAASEANWVAYMLLRRTGERVYRKIDATE